MTWAPLELQGISFISPIIEPAYIKFYQGLNVICGASDTGKSFVLEAIDFMLASTTARPLRDIRERVSYDRVRLALQSFSGEEYTLQRPASGGNFVLFEGNWLIDEPNHEGTALRPTPTATKSESVSTFFLSQTGLSNKYLRVNKEGKTRRLGFRNLVRMVLVEEDEIIKRKSPIVSEDVVMKTGDYAAFKLLLTGVDDSSLNLVQIIPDAPPARIDNNSKAEFIDELLKELRDELERNGKDRIAYEERLTVLEASAKEQQQSLSGMQEALDESIEHRRTLMSRIQSLSIRNDEITSLLSRFDLLKEHYQVDLERLAAIEESGSLFVLLEKKPCPLCGALPDAQHLGEQCEGDVEGVITAARSESEKVQKLLSELSETIADLKSESEILSTEKTKLDPEFQSLNQKIQEVISPLKIAQNSFSDIVKETGEIQRILDKFDRVENLERKKAQLLAEEKDLPDSESEQLEDLAPVSVPHMELSTTVLDEYTQKVQQLLQAWNFPGANRVHFDEGTRDIIINGQPRTSRGKGLRAITHAAMTIGLMEFCREKDLSHPGFVILDSPLLAYYEPESAEDSLEGTDLKDKFYEYLAYNLGDSQVIIIENEHPSSDFGRRIAINDFTKNPNEGRYGFFPYMK